MFDLEARVEVLRAFYGEQIAIKISEAAKRRILPTMPRCKYLNEEVSEGGGRDREGQGGWKGEREGESFNIGLYILIII